MKTILSSKYRIERSWPHSPGRWACVPDHDDLTLDQANIIIEDGKDSEREGMRQRLVHTVSSVIKTSKSRRYSPAQLAGIRRLRGY